MKLDGTTEAALARSLAALPRGWITFAEAARLFSAEPAEYAFGERTAEKAIESFAAKHRSAISFISLTY